MLCRMSWIVSVRKNVVQPKASSALKADQEPGREGDVDIASSLISKEQAKTERVTLGFEQSMFGVINH